MHTFTHTHGHTPGRPVDPTLSDPVMSEDRRQFIYAYIKILLFDFDL